jgi:undecaprenyl diphosphate synthase
MRYLTLYAFSDQNWGRPEEEVGALMGLLLQYIKEQREEIMERRIRLRLIGDEARLPAFVREPLKALIKESEAHEGMTLTLALSYGGREELVRATQRLAERVLAGELSPSALTEAHLSAHLDAPDLPDPDLILRTSGEQRLSNFLLWQCAYSELYFLDRAWPEVSAEELLEVFERFNRRQRRFGLTGAQAEAQDSNKNHT